MSAVSGIPGFSYPAFAYDESEFAQFAAANVTVAGLGNTAIDLAVTGGGNALYVRSASASIVTSAVVGTRSAGAQVVDPDGNVLVRLLNPNTTTASTSGDYTWSDVLASSYVVTNKGFAPLPNIVLPPGYKLQVIFLNTQAGDVIQSIAGYGLKIPTAITPSAPPIPTPPMLLT